MTRRALLVTGGFDGGGGWKGDVKTMQLLINKLLKTGRKPKYSGRQALRLAAHALSSRMRRENQTRHRALIVNKQTRTRF